MAIEVPADVYGVGSIPIGKEPKFVMDPELEEYEGLEETIHYMHYRCPDLDRAIELRQHGAQFHMRSLGIVGLTRHEQMSRSGHPYQVNTAFKREPGRNVALNIMTVSLSDGAKLYLGEAHEFEIPSLVEPINGEFKRTLRPLGTILPRLERILN